MAQELDAGLKRAIEQARVEGTVVDGASGKTILGLTGTGTIAKVPEDRGERAVDLDAEVARENRGEPKKAAKKR